MEWNIEVAHKINLELQRKIELNSNEATKDWQQLKTLTKESIRKSIEDFLNSDEFDKWFENQLTQNQEQNKKGKLFTLLNYFRSR